MTKPTDENIDGLRELCEEMQNLGAGDAPTWSHNYMLRVLDYIDALRKERDHLKTLLNQARELLQRYLDASVGDTPDPPETADDLPPPKVVVIARCVPVTGAYEHDGERVEKIIIEEGDDVRLTFDGDRLRFEDMSKPPEGVSDE